MENPCYSYPMARFWYLRHKEQYNAIQCKYKGPLSLFVNKAVGLKMHFIGFQATCYHADTTRIP